MFSIPSYKELFCFKKSKAGWNISGNALGLSSKQMNPVLYKRSDGVIVPERWKESMPGSKC